MNKLKHVLAKLIVLLKTDPQTFEKYQEEIDFLDEVFKERKYLFVPIKKMNDAIFKTQNDWYERDLKARELRLFFSAKFLGIKELIEDEATLKTIDKNLLETMMENLERDVSKE